MEADPQAHAVLAPAAAEPSSAPIWCPFVCCPWVCPGIDANWYAESEECSCVIMPCACGTSFECHLCGFVPCSGGSVHTLFGGCCLPWCAMRLDCQKSLADPGYTTKSMSHWGLPSSSEPPPLAPPRCWPMCCCVHPCVRPRPWSTVDIGRAGPPFHIAFFPALCSGQWCGLLYPPLLCVCAIPHIIHHNCYRAEGNANSVPAAIRRVRRKICWMRVRRCFCCPCPDDPDIVLIRQHLEALRKMDNIAESDEHQAATEDGAAQNGAGGGNGESSVESGDNAAYVPPPAPSMVRS